MSWGSWVMPYSVLDSCGDWPPGNSIILDVDMFSGDKALILSLLRVGDGCKKALYDLFDDDFRKLADRLDGFMDMWRRDLDKGYRRVGRGKHRFILYPLGPSCSSYKFQLDVVRLFTKVVDGFGYIVLPYITYILNLVSFLDLGGNGFIAEPVVDIISGYLEGVDHLVVPDHLDLKLFNKYLGDIGVEYSCICGYMAGLLESEEFYIPDLHGITLNILRPAAEELVVDYNKYIEILGYFPGVRYMESNIRFHSLLCFRRRLSNILLSRVDTSLYIKSFEAVPHKVLLSPDIYSVDVLYSLFRGRPFIVGSVPHFILSSFRKGGV